jgi:hypothetical protein
VQELTFSVSSARSPAQRRCLLGLCPKTAGLAPHIRQRHRQGGACAEGRGRSSRGGRAPRTPRRREDECSIAGLAPPAFNERIVVDADHRTSEKQVSGLNFLHGSVACSYTKLRLSAFNSHAHRRPCRSRLTISLAVSFSFLRLRRSAILVATVEVCNASNNAQCILCINYAGSKGMTISSRTGA